MQIYIIKNNDYICNVFFIVLDLRLTRLEYGGTPFLYPLDSKIFFVKMPFNNLTLLSLQ